MDSGDATAADLALALRMADAADAVTLPRFRAADLQVRTKPDRSPVTDADTAAEKALREVISAERPDDAVLG
jgi:histidinol-phosphatase